MKIPTTFFSTYVVGGLLASFGEHTLECDARLPTLFNFEKKKSDGSECSSKQQMSSKL